MNNEIVVFGGGDYKEGSSEWILAYEIGSRIAEYGYNVVTGGYFGVMEAASKGAVDQNGEAIGILHSPIDIKPPNDYLTSHIIVEDYLDRLARLSRFSYSIALPGSSGTIAEIMVAVALLNRDRERQFAIWEPYWHSRLHSLLSDIDKQPDKIKDLDSFEHWLDRIKQESNIG